MTEKIDSPNNTDPADRMLTYPEGTGHTQYRAGLVMDASGKLSAFLYESNTWVEVKPWAGQSIDHLETLTGQKLTYNSEKKGYKIEMS
jgi:hypothetical protein